MMRFTWLHAAIIAVALLIVTQTLVRLYDTPPNTATVYLNDRGDITKYIAPNGEMYADAHMPAWSFSDKKISFTHFDSTGDRAELGFHEYAKLLDGTSAITHTRLQWSFWSTYDMIYTYNQLAEAEDAVWIEAKQSLEAATELMVYRTVEAAGPSLIIQDTGRFSLTYDAAIAEQYTADPEGFTANLDDTGINYSFGCRHHELEVSLDEEFWNRIGSEYGNLPGVSFILINHGTDTNTELPCRILPGEPPGQDQPSPDQPPQEEPSEPSIEALA